MVAAALVTGRQIGGSLMRMPSWLAAGPLAALLLAAGPVTGASAAATVEAPPPVSFSKSVVRPGDTVFVRWEVPVKRLLQFKGCTQWDCQVRLVIERHWVQKTPEGYGVWFTLTVPDDACTGGAREVVWAGTAKRAKGAQVRALPLICTP